MNTDEIFMPSVLKVVASETLDISADLRSESTKSISELLLDEEKDQEQENTQEKKA